jgi:hypothetical protein
MLRKTSDNKERDHGEPQQSANLLSPTRAAYVPHAAAAADQTDDDDGGIYFFAKKNKKTKDIGT